MLIARGFSFGKTSTRGFTLIEMMIAIVVGMIAVAGALVLILAINRANSQTIQVARVSQELRALASVISDDIKRARRLHDPFYMVGNMKLLNSSTTDTNVTDAINLASINLYTPPNTAVTLPGTGNCIVYGYQDSTQNDPGSSSSAVNNYRAISWDSASSSVVFISGTSNTLTCPSKTTTGAVLLNSSQIKITGLTFTCGAVNANAKTCSEIDLTISGQLTSGDKGDSSGFNSITRTFTQPIFIRSGSVKTS